MRGGIAERGGVRVGHRIIEINGQSVVATAHEKIVQALSNSVGEVKLMHTNISQKNIYKESHSFQTQTFAFVIVASHTRCLKPDITSWEWIRLTVTYRVLLYLVYYRWEHNLPHKNHMK